MSEASSEAALEREAQARGITDQSLGEPRRAALALLAGESTASQREWAITWMHAHPGNDFVEALARDQIDQLFLRASDGNGLTARLPPSLVDMLSARKRSLTAGVIRQAHQLDEACALLDDMGTGHVVFKGALARGLLYDAPYLRPAVDADLLVAPSQPTKVVRVFEQRGYAVTLADHSDTHEAWLAKRGVGIDLHWSLLRPGRMRVDITSDILAHRVRRDDLWGPNDTHLTVAMLVHPAVTDHVTGRLISAVDLDRWVRKAEVPWDAVLDVLGRIGLRTAAWAMLFWTNGLYGTPVPDEVWRKLAPSPLRQRYIESWLRRNPGCLYQQRPHLVRGAFSLALQDRPSDAARALWKLAHKERLSLG